MRTPAPKRWYITVRPLGIVYATERNRGTYLQSDRRPVSFTSRSKARAFLRGLTDYIRACC